MPTIDVRTATCAPGAPPARNDALDGLRGVAALAVVVTHLAYLPPIYAHLAAYPANLLIQGHNAVMLFFVLSGYVLTFATGSSGYVPYVVKRVCRIYLPYAAVVLVAAALATIVPRTDVAFMGEAWTNRWNRDPTPPMLVEHLLFLPPFDTTYLISPIWSLVHEMRVSLIFPALYFALRRAGAAPVLLAGAAASGVASYLVMHGGRDMLVASMHGGWLPTVHYVFMFLCGAALATARGRLRSIFASEKTALGVFAPSAAIFVCAHPLALLGKFPLNWMLYDWLCALGAVGMIACLLGENAVARAFRLGPARFLGRISYSLYLTHVVVVMTIFRALAGVAPFWAMLALSVAAIPLVAYAGARGLEEPTMRLGRVWAERFAPRRVVPVVAGETRAGDARPTRPEPRS